MVFVLSSIHSITKADDKKIYNSLKAIGYPAYDQIFSMTKYDMQHDKNNDNVIGPKQYKGLTYSFTTFIGEPAKNVYYANEDEIEK